MMLTTTNEAMIIDTEQHRHQDWCNRHSTLLDLSLYYSTPMKLYNKKRKRNTSCTISREIACLTLKQNYYNSVSQILHSTAILQNNYQQQPVESFEQFKAHFDLKDCKHWSKRSRSRRNKLNQIQQNIQRKKQHDQFKVKNVQSLAARGRMSSSSSDLYSSNNMKLANAAQIAAVAGSNSFTGSSLDSDSSSAVVYQNLPLNQSSSSILIDRLIRDYTIHNAINVNSQQVKSDEQQSAANFAPTTSAEINSKSKLFKFMKLFRSSKESSSNSNSQSGDDDYISKKLMRLLIKQHNRKQKKCDSVSDEQQDQPQHQVLINRVPLVLGSNNRLSSSTSTESRRKTSRVKDNTYQSIQITLDRSSSTSSRVQSHDNSNNIHSNNGSSMGASVSYISQNNNQYQHNSTSFGFTIVGYCPCHIGKVEKGSIADNAGLMTGDIILKVNGKKVGRATCDTIVKLIKNSSQKVTLSLIRASEHKKQTSYPKYLSAPLAPPPLPPQFPTSSSNNVYYNDVSCDVSAPTTAMTTKSSINHHRSSSFSTSSASNKKSSKQKTKSIKTTTSATRSITTQSIDPSLPSPIPHLPPLKSATVTDSDYRTATTTNTSPNSTSQENCGETESIDQSAVADTNVKHMYACEKLLNLEEKFIELMQQGVQHYSRPLRHYMMIQPMQHQTLFQNIEKLLAINEYQLNQLISQEESIIIDLFSSIGRLYENKTRMSCEAFDIYLKGIESSMNLLSGLNNKNILKFIQESQQEAIDLRTFLLLPLYYVTALYNCLCQIRRYTGKDSDDYACLDALISNLALYVRKSALVTQKHARRLPNPLDQPISAGSQSIAGPQMRLNLLYSSQVDYKQMRLVSGKTTSEWRRVRLLFFEDRLVLVSARADLEQFLDEYDLASSSCSSIPSRTILFGNVKSVKFDVSNTASGEFYVRYGKNNSQRSSVIRVRCLSREEKAAWHELFESYSLLE